MTTTTFGDVVQITGSTEQDSERWQLIAAHSTAPENQTWFGEGRLDRIEPDGQEWFWTPEWQEGESEASKEIQEGKLSVTLNSESETRQYLADL